MKTYCYKTFDIIHLTPSIEYKYNPCTKEFYCIYIRFIKYVIKLEF